MTGTIEFANFESLKIPQDAASAFYGGIENLIGASYVPLIYVGKQQVKGVNYHFIAEQKLMSAKGEKHIVKIAINEFEGKYAIVAGSIIRIY